MDLAEGVLKGDRRALARLLTLVENRSPGVEETLRRLYPHSGRARCIGVTGLPGAGKSTLVYALTAELRRRGVKVGVIAIDPSSPFTRGALLGDRIRMQDLTSDPGVFIRSMATRGTMGGLAAGTIDAMTVMDAFGMDVIIVETVGAGQDEVDVVRAAQTVLVVEIPGTGDEVQSLKAGILEIADIFVVNKADREGVDATVAHLRQLISLQPKQERAYAIPVIKTVAVTNDGVSALADAIEAHQRFLGESGRLEKRNAERVRFQILALSQHRLMERLLKASQEAGLLEELVQAVNARTLDPYVAARRLEQVIEDPVHLTTSI